MTWAPAGMGKGALVPLEYCKVLFVLRLLSKVSLDEVFEKMSSASGGFAPRTPPGSCPWTPLGDLRPSYPLIAHPWKKILRAPMGSETQYLPLRQRLSMRVIT